RLTASRESANFPRRRHDAENAKRVLVLALYTVKAPRRFDHRVRGQREPGRAAAFRIITDPSITRAIESYREIIPISFVGDEVSSSCEDHVGAPSRPFGRRACETGNPVTAQVSPAAIRHVSRPQRVY